MTPGKEGGSVTRRAVGRRAGASHPALLLAGVIAVALLTRVAGLGWGLPEPARYYPYHPDEPVLAMAVLQVDFGALQLSPHFFNYGSFFIYLDRLAVDIASRAGWIHPAAATPEERALTLGAVIRMGRWLAVLMGVLTVVATAALGARLFGPRTGVVAALLLALAPLHLAQGHYFAVDVPATLWTTLCLLLCAGALRQPDRGALALAGACAGLAASTKYNAGVVFAAPLYTLAVTWRRPEWYAADRAAALVYTPLAAALAFLLTTPGILIDSTRFWHGVAYELRHSETGHGLVFVHTPPAWLFHLTRSLPDGLGLPLAVAVLAGVVWAAARHTPEEGLLLVFVLCYYLLIGSAQIKFARYLLPILPPALLLAARLLTAEEPAKAAAPLDTVPPRLRSGSFRVPTSVGAPRSGGARFGALRAAAMGVVLCWTAAYGAAMAAVFTRPDPRDQAAEWIARHRASGGRVALAGEPWFYTAPLTPAIGCTHALAAACGEALPGWVLAPEPGHEALSPQVLTTRRPEYLIASEFATMDPLRLQAEERYSDPMTRLMDALPHGYRLIHTCRNRPALGPIHWFQSNPPVHDLLYPMPDVRIYQRRAPGR